MTTNVRDMTNNEFVTAHQNLVHSACKQYTPYLMGLNILPVQVER